MFRVFGICGLAVGVEFDDVGENCERHFHQAGLFEQYTSVVVVGHVNADGSVSDPVCKRPKRATEV